MVPAHYKLLYSSVEISARVKSLAAPISSWAASVGMKTGQDILTIPLLRGGLFFYADLVREFSSSVELSPVRASAYLGKGGNTSAHQVKVSLEETSLKDRSVLLVDDICDSGRTLETINSQIKERGAAEVRSAVLVKREIDGAFEPDWIGFRYTGEEWFVGYGMDDRERYRNLRSIYVIGQE